MERGRSEAWAGLAYHTSYTAGALIGVFAGVGRQVIRLAGETAGTSSPQITDLYLQDGQFHPCSVWRL